MADKDIGKSFADKMKAQFLYEANEGSSIGTIMGVVSGKGGVGKSMVTGLSALTTSRNGLNTAILDADVTGPSIPKMFGMTERVKAMDQVIIPNETKTGIKVVSTNLVVDNPEDPVVWRGPVITGVVKQFYEDVLWKDIDVMFVDLPPGTGDVPLTVFQSIPMKGIIVVTSPQDLVSMIVGKAVKMAEMMNVPILGIVENMSYLECPTCGEKINVFGPSHAEEIADKFGIRVLAKLPLDPELAPMVDKGKFEDYKSDALEDYGATLLSLIG